MLEELDQKDRTIRELKVQLEDVYKRQIKISTGSGTWEKDIFRATTFEPILCELSLIHISIGRNLFFQHSIMLFHVSPEDGIFIAQFLKGLSLIHI